MSETASPHEKEIARELRLGAAPAPVTRLSRKVLIALGAVSSLAIVAAIAWAMAQKPHGKGQGELYNTEGQQPPDAMAALPSDYASAAAGASVPKLGPPLPGDLGRPMVAAGQTGASPMAPPNAGTTTADQAKQQLAQEQESARTSRLFSGDGSPPAGAAADAPTLRRTRLPQAPPPAPAAATSQTGQGSNARLPERPRRSRAPPVTSDWRRRPRPMWCRPAR